MTPLRDQVIKSMQFYQMFLEPSDRKWDVLEVGIDGDELPGGNYKIFGIGNNYKTMDFLPRLNPDYVEDICNVKLPNDMFDLIILSQTIEHVKQPALAVQECFRLLKPNGFLILDSPFVYPYHGEADFDDYWRFSEKGLEVLLKTSGFNVVLSTLYEGILASTLSQKHD